MTHEMIMVDGVFECPNCPRRVIVGKNMFKVLDQGDFEVQHFGSSGPATIMIDANVKP